MKKQKVITIITIILFVVIICLASFLGIYSKQEYRVVNKVPKFALGMEFTKRRIINLQVPQTEESEETEQENENNIFNEENYKKSEKVIKKRLKNLKAEQYKLSLDRSNGNIELVLPENDDTDEIIHNILKDGTFELKDSETEETLLDTNLVNGSKVVYNQLETGTGVYLQIKFNKEGKQKLEDISKIYIQTNTQEENENGELEDKEVTKKVDIYLDGEKITQTYFGQTITDGILNINVGQASDSESLKGYVKEAQERVSVLNSGILPIKYSETDSVEDTNISVSQIRTVAYAVLAVIIVMIACLIIKYKLSGIIAAILFIGHIALLLFVIRYISDIRITYESICAIIVGCIINYIYIYLAFKNIDLNFLKDTTLKLSIGLIPIIIIAIVLCFISPLVNINGIGKILVWSFITMYLYNLTLTQIAVKTLKK